MKRIIPFVLVLASLGTHTVGAQSNEKLELFFKLSDYFLKRHVYTGLVNYKYASENSAEIELLHKTIGEVDMSAASESEKKAFFINAYNLLVIYQISKAYPIGGPLDKDGFFDKTYYSVAGEKLSLNELEAKMLNAYKDARFHFVLACGAISCPKLYNLAYLPSNVEQLMEERTKLALNDDSFTKVVEKRKSVELSKIFEWYKKDFTASGSSTLEFINNYREEKIPNDYRLKYYEYDWTLNERKKS